jgi:hypothetical protein
MKKALLIGSLGVFGVMALTSCKKDYTCDCTVDGQDTAIPLMDTKKKDATDACDAAETTYGSNGASSSCTLTEN